MPDRFVGAISYAVSIAVALWFIYLIVKVAQHVGAWPFA